MSGEGKGVEQYLTLAHTAQGESLVQIINQLLEVPGIYVFGEFLELPNIQELMNGPYAQSYQLLSLFAYGTFADYMANATNLPPLTTAQKNKLRHLSIVTMASKVKCLPYSLLLDRLSLGNLRELEDLIIEAIYADIVQGKLDQRHQLLEVDCSIGRDIRPQDLNGMGRTLSEWCSGCEAVLAGIEEQIGRADQYKDHQLKVKQQVETEVMNLKRTLKATGGSGAGGQDPEPHVMETREPAPTQDQRPSGKKASKVKGLRGSGKIWSKSN
uniref:COP9 signalosome complex subunit 7a n=1 Tax=Callorhinchus milii TaxID=7868 RepID=V9L904_CALMI